MARKRKSTAEDVVELVSRLHWGAGVTLAILSYVILHWYVGQGITAATEIENISRNFLQTILHVFAQIGQYIFPLLFLFGAVMSLLKSKKQKNVSQDRKVANETPQVDNNANPICPKCGAEMIHRVAKKGSNAGNSFWGCSSFPKCRSTLPC